MSKTKRFVSYSYFRKPKGRRKAIINNSRKKAIPPDDWADKNLSKEGMASCWKLAFDLAKEGFDREKIAKILCKRFKGVSYLRAYYEIASVAVGRI